MFHVRRGSREKKCNHYDNVHRLVVSFVCFGHFAPVYQARLCFTILVDECSRALSVMNVLAMDGNNGVSFCEFVRAMSGMETADHGMVVVNG